MGIEKEKEGFHGHPRAVKTLSFQQGSNLRPAHYKYAALPAELWKHTLLQRQLWRRHGSITYITSHI